MSQGPTGTVDEIGVDAANSSRILIRIDPKYFRPTEVDIYIYIHIHQWICIYI
jgi:GDPmannose 4,6-dehydratase